jgi:hypothetical protein
MYFLKQKINREIIKLAGNRVSKPCRFSNTCVWQPSHGGIGKRRYLSVLCIWTCVVFRVSVFVTLSIPHLIYK